MIETARPEEALLARLWPLITDAHLRELAGRPWVGDPEEHYRCLVVLREHGLPLEEADRKHWIVHPSEALEIARWNDPGRERATELDGRERRLLRLFATAVLTLAEGHGLHHLCAEDTEARLLESAAVFGAGTAREAKDLVAWCRRAAEGATS